MTAATTAARRAHQPAQVAQARHVVEAAAAARVTLRLARYDLDGDPIGRERWLALRADPGYGQLIETVLLPASPAGPRPIMVWTRWVGLDLRPDPAAGGAPHQWLTTVTGGVLDGRVATAGSRSAAGVVHDRVLDDAIRALAVLEEMHTAGSCPLEAV